VSEKLMERATTAGVQDSRKAKESRAYHLGGKKTHRKGLVGDKRRLIMSKKRRRLILENVNRKRARLPTRTHNGLPAASCTKPLVESTPAYHEPGRRAFR
jgi:hypothetical protein